MNTRALTVALTTLCIVLAIAPAHAGRLVYADDRWPAPGSAPLPAGATAADRLIDLGNRFLADPVAAISHRAITLQVDPAQRIACVGVDAGHRAIAGVGVTLHIGKVTTIGGRIPLGFVPEPGRERDYVEESESAARMSSRVALAVAGRRVVLALPAVELAVAEYRGARGVELRLPLVRRDF
jgi:hypothetical protein